MDSVNCTCRPSNGPEHHPTAVDTPQVAPPIFESGFEVGPVMFKFILIPACADSKQKTAVREAFEACDSFGGGNGVSLG